MMRDSIALALRRRKTSMMHLESLFLQLLLATRLVDGFQPASSFWRCANPIGTPPTTILSTTPGFDPTLSPEYLPLSSKFTPKTSRTMRTATTRCNLVSLPSCAAGQQFSVAVTAGTIAALAQFVMERFFAKRTSPLMKEHAAYTSHSVVALLVMALVSTVGIAGWWGSNLPATAADRLLGVSGAGRWLAAIILGTFAMWDIPTSLRVQSLRKWDVIIHHIVMMVIAFAGSTILPMHYILYYFGVAEISSIPLVAYDQVQEWKKETKSNHNNLQFLELALGAITVIFFTWIRAISFPMVTLTRFLPDCWTVLSSPSQLVATAHLRWSIRLLMAGSIGFTALQLVWFSGMVKLIFSKEE